MRFVFPGACASIALLGFAAQPPEEPELRLIFTGDIRGYLSPCGCAKPQIGGVLRLAGVVRALQKQPNAHYVDLGNWTESRGRQDELKADSLAEVFASLRPAVLNVGPLDVIRGRDALRVHREATEHRLSSANFVFLDEPNEQDAFGQRGLTTLGLMPDADALRMGGLRAPAREVLDRHRSNRSAVALFAGPLDEARSLVEQTDFSGLVVFSQKGDPIREPVEAGRATLVTVGDKGRFVGYIEFKRGEWHNFRLISLGPEHSDDAAAHRAYHAYLQRVTAERLIDTLPRSEGGDFVGSASCAPCHTREYELWRETTHASALKTLEDTGNDRDPECVGCHVVGLAFTSGFRDRFSTPGLADVGCESCHGAGGDHVTRPYELYGKAGEASCLPCHNSDHSPEFEFKSYWERIKH